MSTLHLVGGEKGGVGKSVLARVLAQHFIDRAQNFAAVDGDTSHPALVRYYREYTQPVDFDSLASADQIMDRALGADRRVLVDLPAQSIRKLRRWIESGEVIGFAREMGVQIVFWHVTDGGYDSVQQLQDLIDQFGDSVAFVVVKNHARSSDFSQLEQSSTAQAVRDVGGRFVDLPALDGAAMYKIDRFGSSFWAAINLTDGDQTLTPMERRRTKLWLENCYAAFDTVRDWL